MKNKKALLLGLVVLGVLMSTSLASAYSYGSYGNCWSGNCGSSYSYQQPARIGGWFGQSLSYVSTPLRANYIQQPCLSVRPQTYYVSSCGSCGAWGNCGGNSWGSNYGGGYYGGSSYSNYNRYPSYNYAYGGTL